MITSLIVSLIFLAFKFLMPIKSKSEVPDFPKEKFTKIYAITYLAWLGGGALLAWGLHSWFSYFYQEEKEIDHFSLYPDASYWIGMAVILGFSLGLVCMFWAVKAFLKDQSEAFWARYDKIYSFRATPLLKFLCLLLALTGLVFMNLGRNAHFDVSPTEIKVSRLFELHSTLYSMDQINEITHYAYLEAPNGNMVFKPHYEILFDDGRIWNTTVDIREPEDRDDEVFEKISKWSGVEILHED